MDLSFLDKIKVVDVLGNSMIKIPKFYYKTSIGSRCLKDEGHTDAGIISASLIGEEAPGYRLYPAFYDSLGNKVDCFYVAQYKASVEDGVAHSQKGKQVYMTPKETAKTLSENAVPDGHLMKFWEYQALLLLMFANGWDGVGTDTVTSGLTTWPVSSRTESRLVKSGGAPQPSYGSAISSSLATNAKDADYETGRFSMALSSGVSICDLGSSAPEYILESNLPCPAKDYTFTGTIYPYPNNYPKTEGGVCFTRTNKEDVPFFYGDYSIGRIGNSVSTYSAFSDNLLVGGCMPLPSLGGNTKYQSGTRNGTYYDVTSTVTWGNFTDNPLNVCSYPPTAGIGGFRFCCYE